MLLAVSAMPMTAHSAKNLGETDNRLVSTPLPVCDRDLAALAPWGPGLRDVDADTHIWSAHYREQIRKALDTPGPASLKLPRVFIYPFPPEFVDSLLPIKNTTYLGTAYPEILADDLREESFSSHWAPSGPAVGKLVKCAQSECMFSPGKQGQHNLGLLFHHGLAHTYPQLVSAPEEADLFFVPNHFDKPLVADADDQWCAWSAKIWQKHMERFRHHGVSFAHRHGMRDHFTVGNHGMASPGDPPSFEASLKKLKDDARNVVLHDHHQAPYTKGKCLPAVSGSLWPQMLTLEQGNAFDRAEGHIHPAPYYSYLTWGQHSSTGWFRTAAERNPRQNVAAILAKVNDVDKGREDSNMSVRGEWINQCSQWAMCKNESKSLGDAAPWIYYNTTFCLNPPGVKAMRKGIIDALLAGCVPVLVRHDITHSGKVYRWSQKDLLPWHWPAQEATSISLRREDVLHEGLEALLTKVDQEQIQLMQQVIAATAENLLWPFVPDAPDVHSQASAAGYSNRKGDLGTPRNALTVSLQHLWFQAREAGNLSKLCALR